MNGLNRQDYKEYLKSEHWMALRNKVISQLEGRCSICTIQSALNDVHHIFYCGSWYKTLPHQLAVLCRECHDDVHELMRLDGEEPTKPADHFRRFFKIRDRLRARIPGLTERINSDEQFRRLVNKRAQSKDKAIELVEREQRRQDRFKLRIRMNTISVSDLKRVLKAMDQVGIAESPLDKSKRLL